MEALENRVRGGPAEVCLLLATHTTIGKVHSFLLAVLLALDPRRQPTLNATIQNPLRKIVRQIFKDNFGGRLPDHLELNRPRLGADPGRIHQLFPALFDAHEFAEDRLASFQGPAEAQHSISRRLSPFLFNHHRAITHCPTAGEER